MCFLQVRLRSFLVGGLINKTHLDYFWSFKCSLYLFRFPDRQTPHIVFTLNIRTSQLITILLLKFWKTSAWWCIYKWGLSSKQRGPWSDAAFCGVWSGSTLFAQACLSKYGKYGFIFDSVDSSERLYWNRLRKSENCQIKREILNCPSSCWTKNH